MGRVCFWARARGYGLLSSFELLARPTFLFRKHNANTVCYKQHERNRSVTFLKASGTVISNFEAIFVANFGLAFILIFPPTCSTPMMTTTNDDDQRCLFGSSVHLVFIIVDVDGDDDDNGFGAYLLHPTMPVTSTVVPTTKRSVIFALTVDIGGRIHCGPCRPRCWV